MSTTSLSTGEVCERGQKLYEALRPQLEPAHKGEFLVIDVETGAYEIDPDHLAASDRAHAKRPDAPLYAVRIGWDYVARIGNWRRANARLSEPCFPQAKSSFNCWCAEPTARLPACTP